MNFKLQWLEVGVRFIFFIEFKMYKWKFIACVNKLLKQQPCYF